MPLLEPKEIEVRTIKGDVKKYIIHKFPAVAGREIVASYPLSALPKISEYAHNEKVMLKLMAYVCVPLGERGIALTTTELIDNHVPDWETLVKIEIAMMEYNTSFFGKGEILTFCKMLCQKFLASVSPTLTPLLQQLSEAIKQRLKNSEKIIP